MSPIVAVLVAHLLGDWVIQTDWAAANKTKKWSAMFEHLLTYHVALMLALALSTTPAPIAWMTVGISFVTHGFLDRRWPVVWLLEHTGSANFSRQMWGVLCADQALHISILLLCIGWS